VESRVAEPVDALQDLAQELDGMLAVFDSLKAVLLEVTEFLVGLPLTSLLLVSLPDDGWG